MDQKISSDLFLDVLDDCVKRGAELPTDHYLVVCFLQLAKPWPNRKSNKSSVTYMIKWEALEDREGNSLHPVYHLSSDNFTIHLRTCRRNSCCNISSVTFHQLLSSRYTVTWKAAILAVSKSKKEFSRRLNSNYLLVNKVFWQTISRYVVSDWLSLTPLRILQVTI